MPSDHPSAPADVEDAPSTIWIFGGAGVGAGGGLAAVERAQANAELKIGKGVGADANIVLKSKIKESSYAVRTAEDLSEQAQQDVDRLLAELSKGNVNPGIGTRALGDKFFELRGRNAGRVIVRQIDLNAFDIVGKFQGHVRGDAENSAMIQRFMNDYLERQR